MSGSERVTYFVRYRNLPEPQADFLAYYRTRHAEILREWPGIRRLTLHVPAAWKDPFPVNPDGTDFLAEMEFDSEAALDAALASAARARARADFANLSCDGAVVTHQAMRSIPIF
ncbi:MAG: EthD family reductase [Rhodospirillaceae bacterium]|nr:EthD family reductase [Rhodospirillaceae bacterium]